MVHADEIQNDKNNTTLGLPVVADNSNSTAGVAANSSSKAQGLQASSPLGDGTNGTCDASEEAAPKSDTSTTKDDEDVAQTFPQKLMEILDDEANCNIISWLPHGKGFMIREKKRFAEEILPKHFKKSKFTSFTRKLNRWNFVRVTRGHEAGAYYHPLFQKGNIKMCTQMSCISAKLPQQLQPMDPVALGLGSTEHFYPDMSDPAAMARFQEQRQTFFQWQQQQAFMAMMAQQQHFHHQQQQQQPQPSSQQSNKQDELCKGSDQAAVGPAAETKAEDAKPATMPSPMNPAAMMAFHQQQQQYYAMFMAQQQHMAAMAAGGQMPPQPFMGMPGVPMMMPPTTPGVTHTPGTNSAVAVTNDSANTKELSVAASTVGAEKDLSNKTGGDVTETNQAGDLQPNALDM